MTKVSKNTENQMLRQEIKSAVSEALMEAGISTDMVSLTRAYKLLQKSLINKGIKEGKIRTTGKQTKNSKILIRVSDIISYRESLLNENVISVKQN